MPAHGRSLFFATTRWSMVPRCGARRGRAGNRALGSLVRTYWQPLYRYARRKGKTPEDAEDLVQGFLAHVIEARALRERTSRKADSARSCWPRSNTG